ncbi:biosynthetic-type acetolactate synthase large subunit [Clostridium neuense]|uniref:Acetolactate synthase n=1 Tax=Clostridium neuense TaxID=1728934 RepID=A0ABW8TCN4_9CLOT
MKCSGAEITIRLLEREGVKLVAGIPGGSNLPIYNELHKNSIKHILARHEQGAGFICHGIARTTGEAAVCFATSGPGVTNLITAIADAKLDSIPIVAITGQVPYKDIGTDAFQEVDTYGLTLPITKHNFLVRSAKELKKVIPEAFKIAKEGRPGPVVVDIPKDVQMEEIEFEISEHLNNYSKESSLKGSEIEKVAKMINNAKKPVMCIGGGIINSNSEDLVKEISNKNNIPVAATLMGLGTLDAENPLYLGMFGMHGAAHTNLIMEEADLILGFGIRFDDRSTGNIDKFCPNAAFVHVDIDPAEIDKLRKSDYSIAGNINEVLRELIPRVKEDERLNWVNRINDLKEKYPIYRPHKDKSLAHPINLVEAINNLLDEDTIITTDVGQHQMWVAQYYKFRKPRTFLTSGGLGTMGFGLPAAIGAALANPNKKVVCISGDGSFLMNVQELSTLAELNLNVTIVVMNNSHLGLVRQQQELFYDKNYIASDFPMGHDFAAIASGFGVKGYNLNDDKVLSEAFAKQGPCLINAPIYPFENVLPMVPPGGSNSTMLGGNMHE